MGYIHEKSNCSMSNTFMPLLALSTMSLPSVKTMIKEDEVGMGVDWIENFPPVCQQTIRNESTQEKAVSLLPCSITGLCHVICYLFKKLKPLLHQLNSKNNGLVLLFKTILALISFPVICCNGLQGLKMD